MRLHHSAIRGFRRVTVVGAMVAVYGMPIFSQTSDASLGIAVKGFLTTWIIQRDPEKAVNTYVSRTLNDERFVPARWFSVDEYHEKFDGLRIHQERKIEPSEFARRMTEYLAALTADGQRPATGAQAIAPQPASFDALLQPFAVADAQKIPKVWEVLELHKPGNLSGLPALVYPVDRWRDFSWTASGTVAFRAGLVDRARSAGVPFRVVVVRLRSSSDRLSLLFMLWADETSGKNDWKLWAAEPVPVD